MRWSHSKLRGCGSPRGKAVKGDAGEDAVPVTTGDRDCPCRLYLAHTVYDRLRLGGAKRTPGIVGGVVQVNQ